MSTKLPWMRLFSSQWIIDVSGMSIVEKGLYMTLFLYMCEERRPIVEDAPKLARWAGCSVRVLKNALNSLLRDEKIIRLEDGRLWNLKVEEELNNSNENLNRLSEKASKAAKARWDKTKDKNNSDARAMHEQCTSNAINNNINIYNKKTKTIILSKKETDFENLEIHDQVEEPIEADDVESQSEQIETVSENQPPIHEQNTNTSNEVYNRWQIDEALIEKLPSRKIPKVGKQFSEIVNEMFPAHLHEQAAVPKKAKRSKGKKELGSVPEDFQPDLQYAVDKGLTHDEVLAEFERFKLHWKANPCRNPNERDWQSAWYYWLTSPIGAIAKKNEKLEREKRYANEYYKSSSNNFANTLSESFNQLATAIHAGDTYGSECIRNREVINSFANAC